MHASCHLNLAQIIKADNPSSPIYYKLVYIESELELAQVVMKTHETLKQTCLEHR